jgi:hypothetical protein
LVVLSVLGVTSALAVREVATAKQTLAMRQNRIQAEWLARSGAEFAVGKLLGDENYSGESVELISGGPMKISVEKDAAKSGTYRIRCEATYPTDDYRSVHAVVSRIATRKTESGKVTIALTAAPDAPPGP